MEKNYRVKTLKEKLGVGESTIWLWIKQGKLKSIKISDRVTVIPESEVQKLLGGGE